MLEFRFITGAIPTLWISAFPLTAGHAGRTKTELQGTDAPRSGSDVPRASVARHTVAVAAALLSQDTNLYA